MSLGIAIATMLNVMDMNRERARKRSIVRRMSDDLAAINLRLQLGIQLLESTQIDQPPSPMYPTWDDPVC